MPILHPFPYFAGFEPANPYLPSFYAQADDLEQRIMYLCREYCKLVQFTDSMVDTLNDSYAVIQDMQEKLPGLIDDATAEEIGRLVESGQFAEMLEQAIISLDRYIPAQANPIYYGADPTGEQDSTKAIQDAIDANAGGAITLSLGTYKITEPLKIPFDMDKKVSIFGNGATIVAGTELRAFIMAGTDRTDETANFAGKSKIAIQDLELLANGFTVNYGVEVSHGFKDLSLVNVTIQRATHGVLIGSPLSWDTRTPNDVLISNCMFYGTGSEFFGYGVMAIGTDNKIVDSRIYGYRVSVLNEGGGLFMNNVHGLLRWRDQDETWNPWPVNSAEWNEYYNQTAFIETKNTMQIINCYGDSQLSFMKVVQTGDGGFPINIDSCMYYNSRSDAAVRVFDIDGTQLRMSITNCEFSLRSKEDLPNVECSGLHLRRALDVRYSHLTMSGNDISSVQWLSETDLLKCAHKCQRIQNSGITKDAWYIVGCVPICSVGLGGANTFVANVAGSRFASILNASGGANGASYAYGGDRKIHRAPSIEGLQFGLSTKQDTVTGMYSLYVCAMLPSETTAASLTNVAIFLTDVMMGQSNAISYFNNGGGRGVHPSAPMQLLSDVLGTSEPDYVLATE